MLDFARCPMACCLFIGFMALGIVTTLKIIVDQIAGSIKR